MTLHRYKFDSMLAGFLSILVPILGLFIAIFGIRFSIKNKKEIGDFPAILSIILCLTGIVIQISIISQLMLLLKYKA